MLTVSLIVVWGFVLLLGLSALWPLMRGPRQALEIVRSPQTWLGLLWMLGPLGLYYGVAGWQGWEMAVTWPYGLGSALISWGLAQTNLPMETRRGLLCLMALGICLSLPETAPIGLMAMAMLAGLSAWVLEAGLYRQSDSVLESVLPTLLLLTGLYWIQLSSPSAQVTMHQTLLLSVLAFSAGLFSLQRAFSAWDKPPGLRLSIMAFVGGLGIAILLGNVLVFQGTLPWAILYAASIVFLGAFAGLSGCTTEANRLPMTLLQLLLLGLALMVVSRLFGMMGLLVLSAGTLVLLRPGLALLVGTVAWGRGLLQGFLQTLDFNITGVNLLHPYVYAMLFAGLVVGLLLPLALERTRTQPRTGLLIPGLFFSMTVLGFFFHAQPLASFLGILLLGSGTTLLVYPALFDICIPPITRELTLLLPGILTILGLFTRDCLTLSGETTRMTKLGVLAAIMVIVLMGIQWLRRQRCGASPSVPVT